MNQKTRLLIHMMLILLFILIGVNSIPVNAAYSSIEKDESEIKNVINKYFTLRYDELLTLTPSNYSDLLNNQDSTTINWQKMEKNRFDIQNKIANTFEDYVLETRYSLNYTNIDISDNLATVTLLESNEIVYSSNPNNPSKMGDLYHKIILSKGDNGWIILEDQYVDELTDVLNNLSMAEIFLNIEKNHETITNKVVTHLTTSSITIT